MSGGSADAGWVALGPTVVHVEPGVFPPQPDTVAIIAWCGEFVRTLEHPVVVDLCTGSGVIALALAALRPDARIVAVDNSVAAIRSTMANAARLARELGVDIAARHGDATDPRLLADLHGVADLVVANPPYLPDGSRVVPELAATAEPTALFGGPDGLEVIRGIVAVAAATLCTGGWVAIEHAAGQQPAVCELLGRAGAFDSISGHRDHSSIPRFVTARRRATPEGSDDGE